ncbi:RDD family protein [Halobacillus sp. MO56]
MNFATERAGFGKRLGADLLDFMILSMIIALSLKTITGKFAMDFTQGMAWNIAYVSYLTIVPVIWGGYIVGKRIVGIKVMKTNGQHVSLWDMFIRECIGKYGLGYLTFGLTTLVSIVMVIAREDKRALHDLMAGTFVYKEIKKYKPSNPNRWAYKDVF